MPSLSSLAGDWKATVAAVEKVEDLLLLPEISQLAAALQEHRQQPEQQAAAALELARAAATRSCAYLR